MVNIPLAQVSMRLGFIAASSALAAKDCSIQKLMEHVLLPLGFQDLMSAQLANRDMHATIATSIPLRKEIFRTPDPDAHLAFLPDVLPGLFDIAYISAEHGRGRLFNFSFEISNLDRLATLNIGAPIAPKSVLQPPPQLWQVTYLGALPLAERHALTVAEVLRHCSDPSLLKMAERMRASGKPPMLSYMSRIELRGDDPALAIRRKYGF